MAYEWGGGLHASFGSSSSCGTVILLSPRQAGCAIGGDGSRGPIGLHSFKYPQGNISLCNVLGASVSASPDAGITELDRFTSAHLLADVWRHMHPCSTVYTWVRPNGEDASRIDRVYAPVSFKFSGCETLSCPLSDHDTVVARFVLPSIFPIGRGLWKLNCRILGEAEFRQGFETRYKGWQTLKPAFASTSQWWDDVKLRIKRYAIEYCVTRARRRREKFSKLCAEVKFGDPSAVIALQTYLDEKYHGARVRARVEAVEAEERPSLRFYQSVSSSAGDRRVPSVRATDGTVLSRSKNERQSCLQKYLNRGKTVSAPKCGTSVLGKSLQGRNTYDLRFTSDVTRQKGVTLLSGVEGLTVTPYERSVWVTVIHVGLEVRQELVATVLGRFGAVKAIKMCSYAQAPGVFNGHRQVRIDLKQDIPSFLFIAGHKAHVRYPGQPRTCFRCGETGHEAKGCPNKKCGRCLRLGHDTSACPSEVVCSLCGKEGHVFRVSLLLCLYDKEWGSSSGAPTAPEEAPRKEGETGEDSLSAPPSPSPVVADPNPVPAPRKSPPASPINPVPAPSPPHSEADTGSPPASPINPSSSVPSPPPVSPDPETLSDDDSVVGSPEAMSDSDSGGSVIVEPKRATGTSWYDEMGEPSLKRSASSDDSDDDMSSRARLKLTESTSA
ncbi:putative zinc finger CCHC domain-containing protein 3-like [Apostichopus japonicus]|uniref:Putative zinc finger CCHC domain-containing protein 3-like n=1 Tax=Stichopus japonicus TaxID=307972 RepID=A0A2G8KD84_STIJA|nr:putative zinc finger CCHC domain-containing protein 3-like [Apostichopus japonicus]